MALAFNLAAVPVKFVAVPILAGLAAGTGALGAYVTASPPPPSAITVAALPATSAAPVAAEQAAPADPKPQTKSCDQQTWPYLDNRCLTRSDPARKVRLVKAPRDGDAVPSAASPPLVSSDTVLRGPGVAPEVKEPVPARKTTKRSTKHERGDFRRVYSVYSVPGGAGERPVIVVRPLPLPLNHYSSR